MTLRSRIAIVEHNGLVRRGLAQLLDEHPPVHVVAMAAEPTRLSALPLDVVVYGPSAADEDDLDAAVRRLASRCRVLVLAEFARPGLVSAAIRAERTAASPGRPMTPVSSCVLGFPQWPVSVRARRRKATSATTVARYSLASAAPTVALTTGKPATA